MRPVGALGALAAAFSILVSAAGPAELYGRPLRGLTLVPLAEVARDPGRFAGREIRISGKGERAPGGGLAVTDGEASVALQATTFSLPQDAAGARITAEGMVSTGEKRGSVRFMAAGMEVTR